MLTKFAENWDYTPDVEISTSIFRYLAEHADQYPRPSPTLSQLCSRCAGLKLLYPHSHFNDTLAGLAEKKPNCDLCTLLYSWCSERYKDDPNTSIKPKQDLYNRVIEFSRAGPYLAIGKRHEERVASLTWAQDVTYSQGVPRGIPTLPEPGGALHMKILSLWLEACDKEHSCLPKSPPEPLPTRLIDVSPYSTTTNKIRLLYSTIKLPLSTRYVALSHRWGFPQTRKKIRTTQLHDTISLSGTPLDHRDIDLDSLPETFQDAILATRGLGVRHLWIDSLCIIQNSPEDWTHESEHMESVFSGAYCTVAAASASGNDDGFLGTRPKRGRHVVVVRGGEDTPEFYVCEMVDDFEKDVGQSELQRRGWVLQERALSRRTIHFAGRQTYWECGEGVRCETLTRMNNDKAAFLGDADFPSYAVRWSKGKRIKVIQGLYEQYSAMGLTYARDRPAAIRGLEARLVKTIGGPGGFGIFRQHMYRYLLWMRSSASGPGLRRVTDFVPPSTPPPSWSWMAYSGEIKYVDVPGVGVEWDASLVWPHSESDPILARLEAPVRNIVDIEGMDLEDEEAWISMDGSHTTVPKPTKCVVVGTQKIDRPYCWVLIVGPVDEKGDLMAWQRLGVGMVKKTQVVFELAGSDRELYWIV